MKSPMKAALLSAFVFPGVGHLFLKKYIQATILIGTSLSALYYLTSKSIELAMQVVEKIQNGDIAADVNAITESLTQQAAGNEAQLLDLASYTIMICWIIGIFDSYRAAYLRDKTT
ncbi:MAG: hypothetical protein OEY06_11725 [Gammaproteobacteria bacterium]|nr:hypothetical protein [Gammaproteobacteria bacterium]